MCVNITVLIVTLISTFVRVDSFSCRSPNITQVKQLKLNVVVFVPLPDNVYDPAFNQGYSIIPAVELAIDQINKRTDILPRRYFELNVKDAGCDKASKTAIETVSVLRELLEGRHGPVAIIGPACSEDSVFVANTFRRVFNLPVFYSGTTPYLSEHADNTPNAFGMVSSAADLTDTLIRIGVEEKWNWKNIAVLYDNTREHFQDVYDAFVRGLNNSEQVGYTRQIAPSQIPLAEIIERNIRIVIVFCDKEPARQLACLAGQSANNYIFPIQQFIFIEKSLEDFLGDDSIFTQGSEGKKYYCDEKTIIRGLNGSVLLNQALDSVDPRVVTVSNYTTGQIKQKYKERLSECRNAFNNTTLSETSYAYSYYDAMWAFAIGLHIAIELGAKSFDDVHNVILNNVSFQGVSSWIEFSNRRHVSNTVTVLQVLGSAAIEKGLHNGSTLTYASETFISDKFKTENVSLHTSLAVLGLLTSIVLLAATTTVQIIMIVYRDYPSIKASSTRLNHFIYLGCYLFSMSILSNTFRLIIPAISGNVLCNVDILCGTLASSLIFGAILAKSWRTYKIFNHVFKSKSNYSLHDATLSTFIVFVSIVQGIFFVPMLILSPFNEVISFEFDSTLLPPVKRLKSLCVIESIGYITLPLLFQLCLVLGTVFLATLNRNVKRKNFRTTKQIMMLVYTLTIIWAIGGPLLVLFYHLKFSVNITYFFYNFLLFVTVVLCLILLIVPFLLPAVSGQKVSHQHNTYSTCRRSSTQLSILSFRKFSFRHSFAQNRPQPLQLQEHRRSSLPPTIKGQASRTHAFRTFSLRSSGSGSQLHVTTHSCSTSLQTVSDSQASSISRGTLQSISESFELDSPLEIITKH